MVEFCWKLFICLVFGHSFAQAFTITNHAGRKTESETGQNPIRKVVTMLKKMQQQVEEEGAQAEQMYNKFMCYCKNNQGLLEETVKAAGGKLSQLTAELEAEKERYSQLEDEIQKHEADARIVKDAIRTATLLREKESAAFKAWVKEQGIDMDVVNSAAAALLKGMGSSFLQSATATQVRKVAGNMEMDEEDKEKLLAFLASSRSNEYSPSGNVIVDILKDMARTLDEAIGQAVRAENRRMKSFQELVGAKKKELEASSQALRTKGKRKGELKLMIVQRQEDLENTQKTRDQDKKFAARLRKSCSTKSEDYANEARTRQQEVQAIAETIKILTDEGALDVLKQALPRSDHNFLQMQATVAKVRGQVSSLLHKARSIHAGDNRQLDLILLALDSKKVNFDMLISKIDTLIKELKDEQQADTKKKVYCNARFDRAEDKGKDLERTVSDLTTAISSEKEGLAAVQEDLANLDQHIKELDKEVAEATEQRREEHATFAKMMADSTAAKDLLTFAKQRLQKFYGATLVQTKQSSVAPPESHKTTKVQARGALSMIDILIADIETDMAAAKAEEKHAQADYEELVLDAKDKRAAGSKAFMAKEGTRANLRSHLEDHTGEKKTTTKELMTHEEKIASLHKACDWLLKNFDTRRAARSDEIENLKNGKLVLAGA